MVKFVYVKLCYNALIQAEELLAMEISYWQSRWIQNNTGWHMQQINPLLKSYWRKLSLDRDSTVLVPLCGKSLDMNWLADQGHRVIGVEVSEIAVREFFKDAKQSFNTSSRGPFTIYTSGTIQLWLGDLFKLQKRFIPPVDAVYDKAALIAFPQEMRKSYAFQIRSLCRDHTQIFLNSLEYEQDEMSGPPFSVTKEELKRLYGSDFNIRLLYEDSLTEIPSNFRRRGLKSSLAEKIYHLLPG